MNEAAPSGSGLLVMKIHSRMLTLLAITAAN